MGHLNLLILWFIVDAVVEIGWFAFFEITGFSKGPGCTKIATLRIPFKSSTTTILMNNNYIYKELDN